MFPGSMTPETQEPSAILLGCKEEEAKKGPRICQEEVVKVELDSLLGQGLAKVLVGCNRAPELGVGEKWR